MKAPGTGVLPGPPDGIDPRHALDIVTAIIVSAQSRSAWDNMRKQKEQQLAEAVKQLPIYPWASEIRGFGDRGLAIVIAEASGMETVGTEQVRRTVGEYRTVSGLWKRMGLAVIDGQRQRKVASREGGIQHAYKPARRAECWVLSDSLIRAQLCSELRDARDKILAHHEAATACEERGIDITKAKKIEVLTPILEEFSIVAERYALGPYGEVYLQRRAHTAPRVEATADLPLKVGDYLNPLKWSPGRCHSDAVRVMFKRLLRDLWVAWRRIEREHSEAIDAV
jgi:hypothetical protein